MEVEQVRQFRVQDVKLFPNELFKQEKVFLFVHIVQSIYVGPDGSADLPPICVLQAFQAIGIWVDILEFANVDKVFGFHNLWQQLEVMANISLLRV